MQNIEVPKTLTVKSRTRFETAVRQWVEYLCGQHGIKWGDLRITAMRSSVTRRVYPSIQIINPSGTAKEHYAIAQDIKAAGIHPGMLFAFRRPDNPGVTTSLMFYPLTPTDETPRP
jgi:hypothetical protein